MFLNKLKSILFSTRLMAVLFIAFALSMAIGTFLDAGQDTSPTPYSRNLIYNTWWFEAIMVFFVINFTGNIFRFRLYKREKWPTLLLHLSFVLILLGAFVTRYFGFEGVMSIREGESSNQFLSRETYVTVYIDGDFMIDGVPQRRAIEKKVDFSQRLDKNNFQINTDYNGQPITIELEKFIGNAEEDIVPDDAGEDYLKIVEADNGMPHNHFLKVGQIADLHSTIITLNNPVEGALNLTYTDGQLFMNSPIEGEYLQMATGATGKVFQDSLQPLKLRSRYILGNKQLVFPKSVVKGTFGIVEKSTILKATEEDGAIFKITSDGETKRIGVLGAAGYDNPFKDIQVGGLTFSIKYGSKLMELPFYIKLNDFIAERYPGTENGYSSFSSKITVMQNRDGTDDFDYKIYMNNVLDQKGYRFFQNAFDPDEKGTILSVNHDFWGTWITYTGYILLYLGLMLILFVKGSRFKDLERLLNKVKLQKKNLIGVFLLLFTGSLAAQVQTDFHDNKAKVDSILKANVVPMAHADKFGRLVIQDLSGRMMPVDTYASQLIRKVSKNDTYSDIHATQAFLSMQESPLLWYNVPIVYVKPQKGDSIRSIIGISETEKYATLADFFTERGQYKLAPYLEDAYKAQIPNGFQKEFKETDQRVNLLYNSIEGRFLSLFPLPNDENNKWISPVEYRDGDIKLSDSLYGNFIKSGFKGYLFALNEAKQTGDFSKAEELLSAFKNAQQTYGSAVNLPEEKINTEILYNKYDVFKKLFSWYLYAGTLLFVVLIIQIFKEKNKAINSSVSIFKIIVLLLFLVHTAALIVRWYISGHAPWSDAYESMIYVAWATMFFGLAFGRKSDLTIAATTFVTSMILMVAHWNWMDPSIANLQPVLDSYWLMIHVAVIVASYGPFALGMILGVVVLFLMIFTTAANKKKLLLNIKELTIINEMALTVGLVMLTIGNFLGGMWANESWGRYWGWDPKETWALISILIYAFVIHMRLVPGLRNRWMYNLFSILAFASILMTYFGVNFYLAGLHSYASGDQILSLKFIAITAGIIAVLGAVSYWKYAKFYKK